MAILGVTDMEAAEDFYMELLENLMGYHDMEPPAFDKLAEYFS